MKIAIEGMDGVGKTSIAKKLATEAGMIYIEKPLTEIFDTEKIKGKENLSLVSSNIYGLDDEIIKAWFFGMGNLYAFLKYKDCDLVIDRHFVSNYFWNGTERTKPIFKNMLELIGVPDITILLYASVQQRMERLYKRDPHDYDLSDSEKHVLGYDKMVDFLQEFNIPYIMIDTENKTLDEVYSEVKAIVDSLNKQNFTKRLVK